MTRMMLATAWILGCLVRAHGAAEDAVRRRDERGDVPGWVLVTVMSAGLVMVIWGAAEGRLTAMLDSALDQVR